LLELQENEELEVVVVDLYYKPMSLAWHSIALGRSEEAM